MKEKELHQRKMCYLSRRQKERKIQPKIDDKLYAQHQIYRMMV